MKKLLLSLVFICSSCAVITAPSIILAGQISSADSTGSILDTWEVKGDSHAWAFAPLVLYTKTLGYTVVLIPEVYVDDEIVYGSTIRSLHLISIRGNTSLNMRVATLGHEIGHVIQPANLDRANSETWAEGISYFICRGIGLDTQQEAFAYMHREKIFERNYVLYRYAREMDIKSQAIVVYVNNRRS